LKGPFHLNAPAKPQVFTSLSPQSGLSWSSQSLLLWLYLEKIFMFTYDLGDGASLRILEIWHAPELLAFVQENRAYLGEWLVWARDMQTEEDARLFIKRGHTHFYEDGLPGVGIWLDERLAGGIGFSSIDRKTNSAEIGYWLGQQAAGRGLMTRSLRAILRYPFDLFHLNRVVIQADVKNMRSRAVAERLGFTLEGIRRQVWEYNGQMVDLAMYSLLAQEWKVQSRS
jgi:ribosomal-protein-serine acetyltransferase